MTDPINLIAEWLRNLLANWGLSPSLVSVIMAILGVLLIAIFVLLLDIFMVWVERKVVARFQDRFGPNRLGPFGLIQPFADVIKLLIKEDITPLGADRVVYNLAPMLAFAAVIALWAVIPFSNTLIGSDINVAVLYIVAVGSIGTLGIFMGGWASNNKFALIGAFRTVAQIVSYEVPMVIALLIPVILARSMSIQKIVESQSIWFIVMSPVAALIIFITAIAELGRAPFDLTEAESELVAGFNVEYTGMKFGMFYASELLHALTMGALISSLFLGGWRGPFVDQVPILGVFYLFLKAFIVYWAIAWSKYSMPRIRIDHLLNFCWKFLTPLALAILIVTALVDKILGNVSAPVYAIVMLAVNILIILVTLALLRKYAQIERKRVAEPGLIARPDMVTRKQ